MNVDLSKYTTGNFDRGVGRGKEALWLIVSFCLFRLCPFCLSPLKRFALRAFGACIGKGVVIKPHVTISFPWKLTMGDYVWLGEESMLLNHGNIVIGNNVCISQRVFLCAGGHNYKLSSFDLILEPIIVEDGAWIAASCWVEP